MLRLLAALILLVIATTASAQTARVVDGDTLELKTGERIRVWGIDAPEGSQVCQRGGRPWQCGDDAAAALEALVDGRELTCTEVDRDRYGRTVATCTVAGRDIGATMVRQGWALDFERYSTGCMLPSSSRLSRHSEGCDRVRSFRVGVARSEVTVRRGEEARRMLPARPARHQPRGVAPVVMLRASPLRASAATGQMPAHSS